MPANLRMQSDKWSAEHALPYRREAAGEIRRMIGLVFAACLTLGITNISKADTPAIPRPYVAAAEYGPFYITGKYMHNISRINTCSRATGLLRLLFATR